MKDTNTIYLHFVSTIETYLPTKAASEVTGSDEFKNLIALIKEKSNWKPACADKCDSCVCNGCPNNKYCGCFEGGGAYKKRECEDR